MTGHSGHMISIFSPQTSEDSARKLGYRIRSVHILGSYIDDEGNRIRHLCCSEKNVVPQEHFLEKNHVLVWARNLRHHVCESTQYT